MKNVDLTKKNMVAQNNERLTKILNSGNLKLKMAEGNLQVVVTIWKPDLRVSTTRGSYNHGSYNHKFLQPGVL